MKLAKIVVLVIGMVLVASLVSCSVRFVEIAAVISPDFTPLIEYSIDREEWRPLSRDEIKRVGVCSTYVRQSEMGKIFTLFAQNDTARPAFSGSIVSEERVIRVEGKGAVILSLELWGGDRKKYAKIILECPE